jgi:hypothetical protein
MHVAGWHWSNVFFEAQIGKGSKGLETVDEYM